jgi:hypothetical protein
MPAEETRSKGEEVFAGISEAETVLCTDPDLWRVPWSEPDDVDEDDLDVGRFEWEQKRHEHCVPDASGRGRMTVMRSVAWRRNVRVTCVSVDRVLCVYV